jgi:hypothetical protein
VFYSCSIPLEAVYTEGSIPPTVYNVAKDEECHGGIKVGLTFTPEVFFIFSFQIKLMHVCCFLFIYTFKRRLMYASFLDFFSYQTSLDMPSAIDSTLWPLLLFLSKLISVYWNSACFVLVDISVLLSVAFHYLQRLVTRILLRLYPRHAQMCLLYSQEARDGGFSEENFGGWRQSSWKEANFLGVILQSVTKLVPCLIILSVKACDFPKKNIHTSEWKSCV